ncbi:mechanosensitive ion channel-like protein family [Tothia fuscella]|uniref:Mechanosensitive ion channel-like protein family n=1 Tax=Tothia fuscella TaxID=1048955 RepID=A0A9P4P042_9PEZI|nr:mechanosensitive ion channel-like protein family [Tothia fuscella]
MTTPVNERPEPQYRVQNGPTPLSPLEPARSQEKSSLEDEGTVIGEGSLRQSSPGRHRSTSHLTIPINDHHSVQSMEEMRDLASPSQAREMSHRLDDDLQMLHVEQQVSNAEKESELRPSKSIHRSRSRRDDIVDDFDVATNPLHEKAAIYKPPEQPNTNLGKIFKKIHGSSFLIRYVSYITPIVLILLIPLLLGAMVFKNATVGGVKLLWFSIWLEIVWLTLWAGRLLAKCLPWPIGVVSSLFTNNSKKWRDMGKQLEMPATLFFWWLAIEISFLPTMIHHHLNGDTATRSWEKTMNKVLISIFVGAVLNFVEKIIIQLIAISFHLRTYQDRIELNKFQIGSLTKLYQFSKEKIAMEDEEFDVPSAGPGSGARTPGQLVKEAQKATIGGVKQFGDVAGKIAQDFTGKQVQRATHPHQVVLTLLSTTSGGQVLARRLYRTFVRDDSETVFSDDLKNAFDNNDEAEAAFSMFDKDMNGDISMEELEAVCVEIGRERKSITASLKDLDSVVSKLDSVFLFVVCVITILVFISLISTSAAGVLTSAGSTVLALSWLFSATAQEFLQSIIFVFVKHPFDVGDRVGVYGNTGSSLKGDDYFVKEISLLYTEFKKMEGHVVQAPNSYLNTLFILNQRRSGGLAEAVPITFKFGTTLDQIDGLRQKLLEFVKQEKREYQANILTELRDVVEAHSITLNIVFFYKSNWQNELLRLQRRNKFICALMVSMQELGIEGPRMRFPGQKQSFPVYLQNVPHVAGPNMGHSGTPDQPEGFNRDAPIDPPFVDPAEPTETNSGMKTHPSILRGSAARPRGESLAAMGRRVDFSLGMKDVSSGDMSGDIFEDRERSETRSQAVRDIVAAGSHSRARTSQERRPSTGVRLSQETGRSTSISGSVGPGRLQRIGTDTTMSHNRSNHRNRFFGRNRNAADDDDVMESGLADVPEVDRIDPRSGRVSPAAWRSSAELDRGGDHASGGIAGPPKRSQTENLEMRRLD